MSTLPSITQPSHALVVHVHVVLVLETDLGLLVRIPHHHVGVGARRNDALLRVHAEHARRRRAASFYPTLERELAFDYALVQQLHAVLDSADAVRDRGEVAEAEFFLVLHAERAVIGADDRQLVHTQALPQVALVTVAHLADVVRIVVATAQRRTAHPLGTLEARQAQCFFEREVEVLRAGFGEHVATLMTCGGNFVQRVAGAHVHDVQRHVASDMAEHDCAMRCFGF